MKESLSAVKQPVQRGRAEHYLLITLICFGASVALTRLFLELTGYPQLGNSELHIAHVLWGGLFLFAAVLVLLLFANPWAYSLGAALGGLGVGLFIDEVGKFITQSNNYFYPWAAPIIYAFFLLVVMLYLRINRQKQEDARAEMYHALALLSEVLDHDLEPGEQAELRLHLQRAQSSTDNPDLLRLSNLLLDFSSGHELHLAPEKPDFRQRVEARVRALENRWLSRPRFKIALIAGLGTIAVLSILQMGLLISSRWSPDALADLLTQLMASGQIQQSQGVRWFTAYSSIQGSIGLLQLISIVLLIVGKEKVGLNFAYFGLLLELTVSNLLAFYFDQFSTILLALAQFILLMGILRFRRRFVETGTSPSNETSGLGMHPDS